MATTFELGITSATVVQLIPEYDYRSVNNHIKTTHRARAGTLYEYKWGEYKRFEFSVSFVTSADFSLVSSWFDSRATLLFFRNDDGSVNTTTVAIMNEETPLAGHPQPYAEYYQGTIVLEET